MAKEIREEGQDPFAGTTTLPIDDEVMRQLNARRRSKEERAKEEELERLRQQKDRDRTRVRYDWPVWLIEAVGQIADKEGVSRSQASAFLMRMIVLAYKDGRVDMKPYKRASRVPRWDWELEIPEPDGNDG